ncbi:hypothetical protein C8R46DRAFT_1041312 [Mycena filopes]|nr:hypothetical protein C8R46DRAFT_1041312 [Mycena filopes]
MGWEYLGEYTYELVGHLSPELYSASGDVASLQFQRKWAKDIRSKASLELRRIRARIALRKAGAPITHAAVDAEATAGSPQLISTKVVIKAFKSGAEHHDHVRVSYDQDLVAHIAAAYPEWLQYKKLHKRTRSRKPKKPDNSVLDLVIGTGLPRVLAC